MSVLLAVDPGLRGCGVAAIDPLAGVIGGMYIRSAEKHARGPEAWKAMARAVREHFISKRVNVLLLEIMRVTPADRSTAIINDLLELNGVQGAIAASFGVPVIPYFPPDWKGQVPKRVMTTRIQGHLTAEERNSIVLPGSSSLDHNVWDAVGIGLYYLGRLHRRTLGADQDHSSRVREVRRGNEEAD